jgi:hypothetical protein
MLLANDNNNLASVDFPSVTRIFMPRYYYFFAYLLWLVMALSIHDAQAARKDTTPAPFFFTDQTDVALDTVVTSNTITVSGGLYSRNGGAFTSASGSVTSITAIPCAYSRRLLPPTARPRTPC